MDLPLILELVLTFSTLGMLAAYYWMKYRVNRFRPTEPLFIFPWEIIDEYRSWNPTGLAPIIAAVCGFVTAALVILLALATFLGWF